MKRILSACVEQTLRFETKDEAAVYLRRLERKRIPYRIDEQTERAECVEIKIARAYNAYPSGEYLK